RHGAGGGRQTAGPAAPGQTRHGRPTSSATMPGLTVRMYEHALIAPGMRVLDVGTGSGYGTGLLTSRFGADHVVSVDVDQYLVDAAAARLAARSEERRVGKGWRSGGAAARETKDRGGSRGSATWRR